MNPANDTSNQPSVSGNHERIRTRKLVITLLDLAGYTRACSGREDTDVAAFLDDYYTLVVNALQQAGGTVVKFIGDAVLAVFEPDQAAAAVSAVLGLDPATVELASRHKVNVSTGANIHLATVAEGELGPPGFRRYDIIGTGVNHTFLMGGGAGVRISEPVYRQLPSDQRGPWDKQKPPAVYRYSE